MTFAVLKAGETIRVVYTDWRGEATMRTLVIDGSPHWASAQNMPQPQWLVCATDLHEPNGLRVFALANMRPI